MARKALIPSQVTARDPKGLKLTDLFAASLNKAGLEEDEAQRVIENADFPTTLHALLHKLATPTRYAEEEMSTTFGYRSGYSIPRSVAEQVDILHELFPTMWKYGLGYTQDELPAGSEGYFAIPRWQAVASSYGEAVVLAIRALMVSRDGHVDQYGIQLLGRSKLRETDRKHDCMEQLASLQPGQDILVLAAQFGVRHRGRSIRRARVRCSAQEFGLGAFEVACMLLTHPNRIQDYDDLWLDCPGDEYLIDDVRSYDGGAPFVYYASNHLRFDAHSTSVCLGKQGSVTGWIPR